MTHVWLRVLAVLLTAALPLLATQADAKSEVRWLQWKTSEVGEKHMSELKAAFERATVEPADETD